MSVQVPVTPGESLKMEYREKLTSQLDNLLSKQEQQQRDSLHVVGPLRLRLVKAESRGDLAGLFQQETERHYDLVVLEHVPEAADIFDLACLLREGGMFVCFLEGRKGQEEVSYKEYARIEKMALKQRFRQFVRKDVQLVEDRYITICCAKKS